MGYCKCKKHPPEYLRELPDELMIRGNPVCRLCSIATNRQSAQYRDRRSPEGYRHRWTSAKTLATKQYRTNKKTGPYTITEKQFIEMVNSPSGCVYGGMKDGDILPDGRILLLGLERIDNSLGHTPENCVPACSRHNRLRGDTFTMDEVKVILRAVPRVQPCGDSDQVSGIRAGHARRLQRLMAEFEKYKIIRR